MRKLVLFTTLEEGTDFFFNEKKCKKVIEDDSSGMRSHNCYGIYYNYDGCSYGTVHNPLWRVEVEVETVPFSSLKIGDKFTLCKDGPTIATVVYVHDKKENGYSIGYTIYSAPTEPVYPVE